MTMKPLFQNDGIEVYAYTPKPGTGLVELFDAAVQCGFASPANDFVHDPIDVRDLLIDNKEATFIIKSVGLSMLDDGISPGDYLIIDRGKAYYPDGIALCCVNGEFTVKRVNVETATLKPANKEFKNLVLSEGDELIVWGMVVWTLKKQYGK